ncbi:MAG: TIR domain-containing protein [Parvularculaceae bacterium]
MSGQTFEYAAFISYNSADRDIARRLQRALEAYSIPKAVRGRQTAFGLIGERIGRVCRDRTDFKSGESLNTALIEALDKSSALVVLCSPDSARSKWVDAEIGHFQKSGRTARIYPLIARTDESGVIVNSYPPALRRTDGDEAIAADLQPAGDGWHDGVLKILASILDVEYDALRQRELVAARRRTRIAYGIAAGMAALSVVAVASSVIAVRQRNRSLENFEDAILIAARSASRINELANETEVPRALIYRFLTDIEADLESLRAMEALRDHPRAQIISVEFQLLLSDLFAEVGLTQDQRISSAAANEMLEGIKKAAKSRSKRLIDSVVFGESNLEFYAGDLEGEVSESLGKAALSAGSLEEARASFERCRDGRAAFHASWELEAEETAEVENGIVSCSANEANVLAMLNRPGVAIERLEADLKEATPDLPALAFARLVLAQLYADNGRLKDAVALLGSELARHGAATEGRQERIEHAKLLETRAKALALMGRIADAASDLKRADDLLQSFLAGDGDDRRVLQLRGELLTTTGEIDAFGGDRARADASFEGAQAILSRLVDFDAARRDWRLARARLGLARADNALRLYEAEPGNGAPLAVAQAAAKAALADLELIAAKDDTVAERLSVVARVAFARTLRLSGNIKGAATLLDRSAAALAQSPAAGPAPAQDLLAAAIADERGDLATAARAFPAARAAFDKSLALQRAFLANEPSASLVARDLLWTTIASAKSLKAAGDEAALKARLGEACALKSNAALSEYSLFARDAGMLEEFAADHGVKC